MKRAMMLTLAMLLALGLFAPAAAASEPVITAPGEDEIVFENSLTLAGHDEDAEENAVRWAVRYDTCERSTGAVAGNVDGFNDDFDWVDGQFDATLDIAEWDAGSYCFVLNTEQGEAAGSRLTQSFYIVDDYAKVGGNVDHAGHLENEDGAKELRGEQLSHALEGVVGDAGPAGIVGSISVNYRQLKETRVFEAAGLSFRAAAGIGANDPMAVAEITTTDGALILVLDRDADPDPEELVAPRGAVVVRVEGSPSHSPYEIDESPGATGADSWVSMVNGNNHVGGR